MPAARAEFDLVSPGPLSKAHAPFETRDDCTLCHEKGKQVVPEKCLACHKELQPLIDAKKGFHGLLPTERLLCSTCHPEHAGRSLKLIKWEPSKERFDHGETGYPLKGKHASVKCEACHDNRLVTDPLVMSVLKERPSKRTYLGLSTACAACHFDEHRGQTEKHCEKCHDESDWKKPPGFNHRNTDYPLTGKHLAVPCAKCHPKEVDRSTPKRAFPAPARRTFLKMKGIPYATCESCHKDVHQNRFGKDCVSCHSTDDWHKVTKSIPAAKAFHDKTRYPLLGAHVSVPCRSCHGPFPGQKSKYRNMAFGKCSDCHVDAHLGQIKKDCDACHTINGFLPVTFGRQEHDRTSYPLEGAHRAVACNSCHPRTPALEKRIPPKVKERLKAQGRKALFSLALFSRSKPLKECETCHADPHGGQFSDWGPRWGARKKCAVCHVVASFKSLTFDHNRDSRYPLTGAHAKAPCEGCHVKGRGTVRYRGLATECEACHADVHAGQFGRSPGAPGKCDTCHTTDDFKKNLRFNHNDRKFTSYPLEGKHASVKCEKCHPLVQVAPNVTAARYKRLPLTCEGCHADQHKGAFRGFEP
jgi:hypothetical protein